MLSCTTTNAADETSVRLCVETIPCRARKIFIQTRSSFFRENFVMMNVFNVALHFSLWNNSKTSVRRDILKRNWKGMSRKSYLDRTKNISNNIFHSNSYFLRKFKLVKIMHLAWFAMRISNIFLDNFSRSFNINFLKMIIQIQINVFFNLHCQLITIFSFSHFLKKIYISFHLVNTFYCLNPTVAPMYHNLMSL